MGKLLSVVIVTFKSNSVVYDCLKSIEKYNDISDGLEVIVVDNYPVKQDAFANVAPSFPWVTSISNPQNGGFGQGNNLGADLSKGEYLLFLNPDVILVEPIFSYAISQFRKIPKIGVMGMLLTDKTGKVFSNSIGVMPEHKKLLPASFKLFLIRFLNVNPAFIFPLGADFFIRKSIFQDVGGFDEAIFLCYEEPDLVRRMPRSYEVRIFKKRIIHLEGHTTNFVGIKARIECALTSERYYFKKYKLNYKNYCLYALIGLTLRRVVNFLFLSEISEKEKLLISYYKKTINEFRR